MMRYTVLTWSYVFSVLLMMLKSMPCVHYQIMDIPEHAFAAVLPQLILTLTWCAL